MKRFAALAIAVVMALTSTVAFAVPSKTTSDMTKINTVLTSGTVAAAPDFAIVLNNVQDEAAATQETATWNDVISLIAENATVTAVGTKMAPAQTLLSNSLSLALLPDATEEDITMSKLLGESIFGVFGAKVFGDTADLSALETDADKQMELLGKLSVDEVVNVNVVNYLPEFGDVTVNYSFATVYSPETPVVAVLAMMPMPTADAQADAATLPTQFIALTTVVNEDGSVDITYSADSIAAITAEGVTAAVFMMSIDETQALESTNTQIVG